jgi:ATP-dependent protease HslVU (ClpYQ) peptidase subunit
MEQSGVVATDSPDISYPLKLNREAFMSIIAAISKNKKVYIGSNTGYTLANDSVINHGIPPWIFVQDWAIGFTGSMLALNVCRSELKSLKKKIQNEGEFVTEIGKILTEYDIGSKDSGEPTWSFGIWCILAHKSGKVWDIDESLCLGPIPQEKFWARGSGEKYALGAARALMSGTGEMLPEAIVKAAIDSAIFNDLYCPGDVFFREL